MFQGTRVRRRSRIPPFRRRELLGIYLAALAFGLVTPLVPPITTPLVPIPKFASTVPLPEVGPAQPAFAQVELVAPAPVVARSEVLNRLADERMVALTFDDGPDPQWTPRVLEVLKRHGAVATFCMVGNNVEQHPALVEQVVDAGMRLCDHSRTHDVHLPDRPQERIVDEVVDTRAELSAAGGGAPVTWFRAPGGNWSPEIAELAAQHGMQPLGWNVDPKDWQRPGADAIVASVQRELSAQAPDGAIILLHDGGGHRAATVAALEQLMPWLVAQGYRFGFPVS